MKSGRLIFLDFLLNFIINGNFLAVYYFFDSLTLSVLLSNLSGNSNGLEVVFLFNSQCNQTLSNFADLFCSSLSSFDAVQLPGCGSLLFSGWKFFQAFYNLPFYFPPYNVECSPVPFGLTGPQLPIFHNVAALCLMDLRSRHLKVSYW